MAHHQDVDRGNSLKLCSPAVNIIKTIPERQQRVAFQLQNWVGVNNLSPYTLPQYKMLLWVFGLD
jgi:hypothetical protein